MPIVKTTKRAKTRTREEKKKRRRKNLLGSREKERISAEQRSEKRRDKDRLELAQHRGKDTASGSPTRLGVAGEGFRDKKGNWVDMEGQFIYKADEAQMEAERLAKKKVAIAKEEKRILAEKTEGKDIDIAQLIEERAKREETREGNIRGDLPLTEEERAGLSAAEIAQFEGPKESIAGKAGEVTPGDVMAVSGVSGLVKGAVGKVAGSVAAKEGVKGSAKFGGLKVHRKGLTDEMFEVLKDESTQVVKPVANAKGIKDYFKFMSKDKKDTSIKNLANKYGFEEKKVRKAIESREFNKDITKIIGDKNFVKSFAKEAFKFGKVWLPAFAGTDVIINWWAMDNIADGLGFALSNYNEGLTEGTLTQEKANEILDEAETTYDMALAKVNSATYANPLMYPARKFIRAGMETKRKIYDIKRANLGL